MPSGVLADDVWNVTANRNNATAATIANMHFVERPWVAIRRPP